MPTDGLSPPGFFHLRLSVERICTFLQGSWTDMLSGLRNLQYTRGITNSLILMNHSRG